MEFVERDAPKNYNVFLFSDFHIGTTLHYNKGLDRAIHMVRTPYKGCSHNIVEGGGDLIEAIDHTDKRFDIETVDLKKIRPMAQMEHVIEMFRPIKNKIVCLRDGNHEFTLQKYFDYTKFACDALGCKYGTYTSITSYPTWKLYYTHGRGTIKSTADDPIRQKSNLLLSLKRKLKNKSADCFVMAMGHIHQLLISPPVKRLYMTSNGEDLVQNYTDAYQNDSYIHDDHRWYVATGSFLRAYRRGVSGYAERAQYDPTVLGFPIITVRNGLVTGIEPIYL